MPCFSLSQKFKKSRKLFTTLIKIFHGTPVLKKTQKIIARLAWSFLFFLSLKHLSKNFQLFSFVNKKILHKIGNFLNKYLATRQISLIS